MIFIKIVETEKVQSAAPDANDYLAQETKTLKGFLFNKYIKLSLLIGVVEEFEWVLFLVEANIWRNEFEFFNLNYGQKWAAPCTSHKSFAASAHATALKIWHHKRFCKPQKIIALQAPVIRSENNNSKDGFTKDLHFVRFCPFSY